MDIVGLGTVAMDVLYEVDALPGEDGFAVVKNTTNLPGGSGTNVIVQASRLGASCGYIAEIGDDPIGMEITASLEGERVDTSQMIRKQGGTSLHTDIVVDRLGKKFILLNLGNSFLSLAPDNVDPDYIKRGKVFFTDLLPGDAAIFALKSAKKNGLTTVVNMQVALPQMESFGVSRETIFDALKYIDVFLPCREGLRGLTETDDVEASNSVLREYFDGLLIVTLGNNGSIGFHSASGKEAIRVPIVDVPVKDTTGAGDSYIGAFMTAYCLEGKNLHESMRYATACSAFNCLSLGARSGPHKSELEKFLAS